MKKKKEDDLLTEMEAFIKLERKRQRAEAIVYWLPTMLGIFWMVDGILVSFTTSDRSLVIQYDILGALWILIGAVSSIRRK